jgi:hypothetical protein
VASKRKRAAMRMKSSETEHFRVGALAANESKFERPDIGSFCEAAVRAQFGRKLEGLFPLPPENSEPENIRLMLRKMQAKL